MPAGHSSVFHLEPREKGEDNIDRPDNTRAHNNVLHRVGAVQPKRNIFGVIKNTVRMNDITNLIWVVVL